MKRIELLLRLYRQQNQHQQHDDGRDGDAGAAAVVIESCAWSDPDDWGNWATNTTAGSSARSSISAPGIIVRLSALDIQPPPAV
jgi:hypothetical protein